MKKIKSLNTEPETKADSRRVILLAAQQEFAAHGLSGARVDSIAERAGLNKRLIYYYFNSKDQLFLEVLEQAYSEIRAAEQVLNLDQIDPIQAIRQLITFTWDYYLEHPEFISLLNSENQSEATHLKKSKHIRELTSPLIQMLGSVLLKGQEKGLFRSGIDPIQLYISIASICYFYLSNNHTLSTIFGKNLLSPKAKVQRLSHMIDLILGYVLL
jgi:AcrR family transcriptional regulator